MMKNMLDISGLNKTRSPAAVRHLSSKHKCLEDCGPEPYCSFTSLSLFVSFVLMLSLPLFPEGVQTLQHRDLERLLEILTSKDLSETPSDHPSSRTECLHNTIYTELCRTPMSWVLDCCETQKMHLRRKSLSLCDSLPVLYTPQIIQKQANMRWRIR